MGAVEMTAPSSNPLRLAGYAAIFDRPDAARDTICKGAFAQAIRSRAKPFPLLWQHAPDRRIGTIEFIEEDARGLRVIARIEKTDCLAAQMLKARKVNGLSFGYRARGYRMERGGRILTDIDLFEISLVTHPLQHTARVHLVV